MHKSLTDIPILPSRIQKPSCLKLSGIHNFTLLDGLISFWVLTLVSDFAWGLYLSFVFHFLPSFALYKPSCLLVHTFPCPCCTLPAYCHPHCLPTPGWFTCSSIPCLVLPDLASFILSCFCIPLLPLPPVYPQSICPCTLPCLYKLSSLPDILPPFPLLTCPI